MKKTLILMCFFTVILAGCIQIVDSTTTFSISEFDEFFELETIHEKKQYINNGNLGFASYNDIVVIPFIKETSHEECTLFVYTYSADNVPIITVESAKITMEDGTVLFEINSNIPEMEFSTTKESWYTSVCPVYSFLKTNTWFSSGSRLQIDLVFSIDDGKEIAQYEENYTVTLIGHKSILMPS